MTTQTEVFISNFQIGINPGLLASADLALFNNRALGIST